MQALKLLAVGGPLLSVYAVVTRTGLDVICAKQDALFGLVQWCGLSKIGSLAVLAILALSLYRWFNTKS